MSLFFEDDECPVNAETREWLENCFLWFIDTFGREKIENIRVLTPTPEDFPITYDGELKSVLSTMAIVAKQMEVNPNDIVVDLYELHNIQSSLIVTTQFNLNQHFVAAMHVAAMCHVLFETIPFRAECIGGLRSVNASQLGELLQ